MRDPLGNQRAPSGLEAGGVHRRDGLGVVDAGVPDSEAHPRFSHPVETKVHGAGPWNRCIGSVEPAGVRTRNRR